MLCTIIIQVDLHRIRFNKDIIFIFCLYYCRIRQRFLVVITCSINLTEHSLKGCVGVVTIHVYVTWGYVTRILLFLVNSLLKSLITFTRSQNASLEL